jgi:hypothetical protein
LEKERQLGPGLAERLTGTNCAEPAVLQIQRAAETLHDGHPSTSLGMVLSIVEGPPRRA